MLDERTLSDKSELSDEDQVAEYVQSETGSQFVAHNNSELSDKSEYSGEDQDDGPSEFAAKGLSSQLSKSVKMLAGTSKVDNVS